MEHRSFKELVERDVHSTFMNLGEFADIHNVDGKEMPIILDDVEIIEREKKMKSNMDGVFVRQKLMYVKAADFGPAPAVGRAVTLDGQMHVVLDVSDEQGVYAITMEANKTR